MLVGASLKPAQFEALVTSFAGALVQLSGDDRSFSATIADDADAAIASLSAECVRRRINARPLQGCLGRVQGATTRRCAVRGCGRAGTAAGERMPIATVPATCRAV
jgi:hypothetical protein